MYTKRKDEQYVNLNVIQCKKCEGMVERSIIQGQGEKKLEPFDIVEITRIIKGIEIPKDKEDVSIRRKARPCELDENINKEPEMPTSFSNLRKIKY